MHKSGLDHGTAGGDGGAPAVASSTSGVDSALRLAWTLQDIVERVSPEEFYWQDAHYDHDSWQGRELLFIANHEWVRGTSEVVDISRSDVVETSIKIDIDLGQITHEAFRNRTGRLGLPVTVLPPQPRQRRSGRAATDPTASQQSRASQHQREPDPFATVTDAAGNLLPMLPAADLWHQISAAMAEVIVTMGVAHWPVSRSGRSGTVANERPKQPPSATRDERLLLSAAIYRMLGRAQRPGRTSSPRSEAIATPRMAKAREDLLLLLGAYVPLLPSGGATSEPAASAKEAQFAPELTRPAIVVLQALASIHDPTL